MGRTFRPDISESFFSGFRTTQSEHDLSSTGVSLSILFRKILAYERGEMLSSMIRRTLLLFFRLYFCRVLQLRHRIISSPTAIPAPSPIPETRHIHFFRTKKNRPQRSFLPAPVFRSDSSSSALRRKKDLLLEPMKVRPFAPSLAISAIPDNRSDELEETLSRIWLSNLLRPRGCGQG